MKESAELRPSPSQINICEKDELVVHAPEKMVAVALQTVGQSPVYGSRVDCLKEGLLAGSYTAVSIQRRLFSKRTLTALGQTTFLKVFKRGLPNKV